MFLVLGKQNLTQTIRRLDIRAEAFVPRLKPGHFVTIMADAFSREVPFYVFETDWRRKCLSVIFEEKDAETRKLTALKINDPVFRVGGPYGVPFTAEKIGTVVCVGENTSLVSAVALCRVLKQAGNKVIALAGFDRRNGAILESQMRLNCSKYIVMYKDGMHERKGDVLVPLKKVLSQETVAQVYAAAGLGMLDEIHKLCRDRKVPLIVSLMPLLDLEPTFQLSSIIELKDRKYYPAVDGVLVPAEQADLKHLVRYTDSCREYAECRRKEAVLLTRPSAFARFRKFVWG